MANQGEFGGEGPMLSVKRQKFVERMALTGNSVQAAREAGYKQPQAMGPRLLKVPEIAEALAAIQAASMSAAIMDKREAEELLTTLVKDEKNPLKERRESLKLLAQLRGWLVHKTEVSGGLSLAHLSYDQLMEILSKNDSQ